MSRSAHRSPTIWLSTRRSALAALLLSLLVAPACANIAEIRTLRVAPLERPRTVVEARGEGFRLKGARDGANVRLEVFAVQRCVDVTLQHADGFERTERTARGASLKMQWIMGGLFSAAAGAIIAYTLNNPAPPADPTALTPVPSNRSTFLQAGAFGGVGLGMLVGSAFQQASLGRSETPLGRRELRREGRLRTCGSQPATAGKVRLTLADGLQIEASVDANGLALVPLPDDVDNRLAREGHGATVEVLGDWRSQARITL
jgi:hypothetical protein